ncbi:MAG: DUF1549 domain-containing protein, partial [Planctomycetaceae bacterium]|nr:DUF1549 domain-containing protein [Planctomycetaceae bacterium]
MRARSFQLVRKLSLLICCGTILAIQSESGLLLAEETRITPQEQFFLQKIRPLLEQKCLGCHGKTPDDIKGEYIMLNREALIKGGESGAPAIIVGKPEQSPFWNAVTWKDESIQMPPQERNRLNAAEIADLKQWIADGAVWSDQKLVPQNSQAASSTEIVMSTSGGQSPTWTGRTYQPDDIWAYQPIQRPEVPWDALTVKQPGERHPIDAFIQQKLKQKQLVSSKSADRKTLLRRATYDLTGLPPTAKQLKEFTTSDEKTAWSALIKRLLQTPQYGEQMAQTWIDVV